MRPGRSRWVYSEEQRAAKAVHAFDVLQWGECKIKQKQNAESKESRELFTSKGSLTETSTVQNQFQCIQSMHRGQDKGCTCKRVQ